VNTTFSTLINGSSASTIMKRYHPSSWFWPCENPTCKSIRLSIGLGMFPKRNFCIWYWKEFHTAGNPLSKVSPSSSKDRYHALKNRSSRRSLLYSSRIGNLRSHRAAFILSHRTLICNSIIHQYLFYLNFAKKKELDITHLRFEKCNFGIILPPRAYIPHPSHRYTPDKCPRPVYSVFSGLSPVMLVCIMYWDIFLNHIPAIAHRAMIATWSPKMVTTPFLQMG